LTADDHEDDDPGLVRQRTALSWFRTALAFAAVGGAIFRAAPVVGGLTLGMGALLYLLARVSHLAIPVEEHRRPALLLVTAAGTAVSLVALATIFLVSDQLFPPAP
jgi:hypothetical protein